MKAISKKLLRKKNNMQYMKSERDILTKVKHPFIVTLRFAFQTETRLFLVMDFLSGGELFFHLKRKGLILEAEARLYLAEIVVAIEFLHSMGVVHRDLKPENVLLRPDGHVCITDFGLAKEVGDNTQVRTLCGTSEYMAPEMLLRNGYTKAVDWWSLGALFFEMLAGKPPFTAKTPKELDRKILSEKFSIPPYVTATAASLLKGLLEKDVNKRLGAKKSTMFSIGGVAGLKQHEFFTDTGGAPLDWHLVQTCGYEPPIKPCEAAAASLAAAAAANPSSSSSSLEDSALLLAANFHEGFTGQCLSPSVIEESYGASTPRGERDRDRIASPSPSSSPAWSRSSSFAPTREGTPALPDGPGVGSEEYPGFEFVDAGFVCTAEQLADFDAALSSKQQRSAKKRDHKAKQAEDKARKAQAAQFEAQQAEAVAAEARAEQERLKQAIEEKEWAKKALRDDIAKLEAIIGAHDEWAAKYVFSFISISCLSLPPPHFSPPSLFSLSSHNRLFPQNSLFPL
jgi:p70 ribosomal S6 kinase